MLGFTLLITSWVNIAPRSSSRRTRDSSGRDAAAEEEDEEDDDDDEEAFDSVDVVLLSDFLII